MHFREKFMKNDVSDQYSRLIISASERFRKMAYIRFDAELNGLQTDVKSFLAIDFFPDYSMRILNNCTIFLW